MRRTTLVLLVTLALPALAATLQLPLGSVYVGAGLYMTPGALDEAGCMAYLPWSPSGQVPGTPHYRRADGSFTTQRAEAACETQTQALSG